MAKTLDLLRIKPVKKLLFLLSRFGDAEMRHQCAKEWAGDT